jgi:hypothetical protein
MIKMPNFSGLVSMGKTLIMSHRPELLFGASVTATVVSVGLAAKGGWDARGKVDEANEKRLVNDEPKLTTKEQVQLTWLCYMPATISTLGALGSTTGLHLVHIQEKRALAQAAMVAIEETKQAVKQFEKENIGVVSSEEKSKLLEERAEKTPVGEEGAAHQEYSDGFVEEMYLVRDAKTGRDIWSNVNRIEEALLHVNNRIAKDGDCELNEFYSRAGFDLTPDGDDWGWSGEFVEVTWDSTVRDDGRPVRRFTFRKDPAKESMRGAS